MNQAHDKIGMTCASVCVVHCATTATMMVAGGMAVSAGPIVVMAHDWLMPAGLLMVILGIVPGLWQHRSIAVAGATLAGLGLWALSLLDPTHGGLATGLEVSGAACLAAAHWLNMTAARRVLLRQVCERGSERAAGVTDIV